MMPSPLRSLRAVAGPLQLLRLARAQPVGQKWGYDRGLPVDRYFIEQFLAQHRSDIHGRVLEVKRDDYASRFGSALERVDVLDLDPGNAEATVVADLAAGDGLPDETFDCFILTQTLQYVFDVAAALRQAARALHRGGVLLATVPVASRVAARAEAGAEDYWRFTEASCRRLVTAEFGDPEPLVRSYGNALTLVALLAGLAAEDLLRAQLERHDARFPFLVSIRAVKR
jgi:SAM-dependent methyltransferase